MKRQTTLLQAVIVLGGFLALAFLCNQSGIEIHLALFAAWFLAMAVGKRNGFSYQEMEHAVTKGIYDGMSAILILLAVGALVGTWISGGIVPSLIYYGLKVITQNAVPAGYFTWCGTWNCMGHYISGTDSGKGHFYSMGTA